MVIKLRVILAVVLVCSFLMSSTSLAGDKGKKKNAAPEISQQVKNDLIQLREEEKLARDVYLHLYAHWGQWIFSNIAGSEQQHMDAVKGLLDKYQIDDPVDLDIQGHFEDQELQALYNYLIARGSESKVDALYVGATIEDLDIFDIYEMMLNATEFEDIYNVYENLSKGSRNHLRSFAGQLLLFDETYVAQYLDQDEVDIILALPMETGSL